MNERIDDEVLRQRSEQFLARVQRTGQQTMVAISEAVAESARRIGRRRDDPVTEMADVVLGSLRTIEREAHRAITEVEKLTKEWQRDDRSHIVIVADAGHAARREPVLPRRDSVEAAYAVSHRGSTEPQPSRGEDLPEGA